MDFSVLILGSVLQCMLDVVWYPNSLTGKEEAPAAATRNKTNCILEDKVIWGCTASYELQNKTENLC